MLKRYQFIICIFIFNRAEFVFCWEKYSKSPYVYVFFDLDSEKKYHFRVFIYNLKRYKKRCKIRWKKDFMIVFAVLFKFISTFIQNSFGKWMLDNFITVEGTTSSNWDVLLPINTELDTSTDLLKSYHTMTKKMFQT